MSSQERLRFPVLKGEVFPMKGLTMDDYVEFVRFNLESGVHKGRSVRCRKQFSVNVPFSL